MANAWHIALAYIWQPPDLILLAYVVWQWLKEGMGSPWMLGNRDHIIAVQNSRGQYVAV